MDDRIRKLERLAASDPIAARQLRIELFRIGRIRIEDLEPEYVNISVVYLDKNNKEIAQEEVNVNKKYFEMKNWVTRYAYMAPSAENADYIARKLDPATTNLFDATPGNYALVQRINYPISHMKAKGKIIVRWSSDEPILDGHEYQFRVTKMNGIGSRPSYGVRRPELVLL